MLTAISKTACEMIFVFIKNWPSIVVFWSYIGHVAGSCTIPCCQLGIGVAYAFTHPRKYAYKHMDGGVDEHTYCMHKLKLPPKAFINFWNHVDLIPSIYGYFKQILEYPYWIPIFIENAIEFLGLLISKYLCKYY